MRQVLVILGLSDTVAKPTQRMELQGVLELVLKDGTSVLVQAGPYGKGVSIVPVRPRVAGRARREGAGTGKAGRPPRPSTLELREVLAKDAASHKLHPASHYLEWLVGKEPKSKRTTLAQTVYRELRAVGGAPRARRRKGGADAGGKRGRAPHPATVALREKLVKDRDSGQVKEASHYVKWVVDKAGIGLKQARPIVYRELRAVQ
ncbi:MAG: hypothetical protein QOD77_335 [Thermoplasmata archaeon]|jgi:hypothetical protein|nr:hypothetical protein [Thermoplasmata archaeon]